ncbi:MAG: hypothetical protein ACR2MY_07430, partial [Candidatus Dormibacteria bacterium]
LVTGCGAAAGAPAVTSTPRPADAATAVAQAIARTAGFIDVKYDQLNTTTAGTSVSAFSGTIVATKNPARTEVKSAPTSGSGAALDSVEDYSAGTFCTVQPGPRQRLTGQSTDAASVSPFSELQNSVTGWSYASDPGGAPQWHARGRLARSVPGATLAGTADVYIEANSGKIVKTATAVTTKRDSLTFGTVTVFSNFVYDTGVTVPAC